MGKGKVAKAAVVIGTGAKLAVKYGPQAKIAWDKGCLLYTSPSPRD